jgi:hypothetical protein
MLSLRKILASPLLCIVLGLCWPVGAFTGYNLPVSKSGVALRHHKIAAHSHTGALESGSVADLTWSSSSYPYSALSNELIANKWIARLLSVAYRSAGCSCQRARTRVLRMAEGQGAIDKLFGLFFGKKVCRICIH